MSPATIVGSCSPVFPSETEKRDTRLPSSCSTSLRMSLTAISSCFCDTTATTALLTVPILRRPPGQPDPFLGDRTWSEPGPVRHWRRSGRLWSESPPVSVPSARSLATFGRVATRPAVAADAGGADIGGERYRLPG